MNTTKASASDVAALTISMRRASAIASLHALHLASTSPSATVPATSRSMRTGDAAGRAPACPRPRRASRRPAPPGRGTPSARRRHLAGLRRARPRSGSTYVAPRPRARGGAASERAVVLHRDPREQRDRCRWKALSAASDDKRLRRRLAEELPPLAQRLDLRRVSIAVSVRRAVKRARDAHGSRARRRPP